MGETAEGALKGAGTGAAIGAVGGPWGAAIGGVAGGIIGGVGGYMRGRNKDKEKQEQERIRREALGYYDPVTNNAAQLYADAMSRTNTGYNAGQIRDVDLTGADALRGRQMGALDQAQQQAALPPQQQAAAQQYAAMMGQNRNAAMGIVAGSRGAGRGAGRLNVASQFGANAGINAAQGSALGMQERQQALAQYAAALQGARGQDQSLATQRAGLTLQRDSAADEAGRQAFTATHMARQGYLNTAGNAVSTQGDLARARAGTATGAYDNALRMEEERRKREAGTDQSLLAAGTTLAGSYINRGK